MVVEALTWVESGCVGGSVWEGIACVWKCVCMCVWKRGIQDQEYKFACHIRKQPKGS